MSDRWSYILIASCYNGTYRSQDHKVETLINLVYAFKIWIIIISYPVTAELSVSNYKDVLDSLYWGKQNI